MLKRIMNKIFKNQNMNSLQMKLFRYQSGKNFCVC